MLSLPPAGLETGARFPTDAERSGRTMARALGALLTLGGVSALLWLALPHPPQAREWPLLGLTLAVLAAGGALLVGAGDRTAPRGLMALTVAATVVITFGVYYAGPPAGGFELFYLSAAAYAFAFFPARKAATIAVLVAVGFAAALAAHAIPANEAIGRWLLCVCTVTIVGVLVRRLVDHRDASEQRFVRGFADSSIGMGLLSADWRWFEVNDALCRMLGRSRHELIGRGPAEITHPEDVAESRAIVDRALGSPSQRAQTFTKRYLRPDGATVWTHVDSIFVKPDRREGYFFAQTRDISTESRAAEEHARQARQQAAAARLGRFALAEQDLDAVMEEVARVVAETLGVEHSGVLELTAGREELRLVAGVGWEPGSVRRAVIPAGLDDPVGRAVREGRPVVIEDAWAPDAPLVAELLRRRGVASGITVQVAGRDGPWGILTAHGERPRRYAADETDFMAAVANVVSGAVDRLPRGGGAPAPLPARGPLVLCVNTSAHQIADGAFPAEVAAIARRSGLALGSLALEITETVLMEEAHAPVTVLAQLRDYGLRLMLDDFGTGYSSLAYLRRFPLAVVKVDGSFIAGLGRDEEDSAIVAAVISMAHTLGLAVVAEGVERAEQVEQLRHLGCDRVQGRLLAGPLPAPELESLMAAGALRPQVCGRTPRS